jgi:MYXO-CTERM domain-containing protein
MRAFLLTLGLCIMIAVAPTVVGAAGNDCQFPGKGVGVGGTPGQNGSPGTFPGGGATGGEFPGGNCSSSGGTVSASEPLSLGLTAVALLGASMLRRRK